MGKELIPLENGNGSGGEIVPVNLRTARQMGLTLSPPFLGRADDVIE